MKPEKEKKVIPFGSKGKHGKGRPCGRCFVNDEKLRLANEREERWKHLVATLTNTISNVLKFDHYSKVMYRRLVMNTIDPGLGFDIDRPWNEVLPEIRKFYFIRHYRKAADVHDFMRATGQSKTVYYKIKQECGD